VTGRICRSSHPEVGGRPILTGRFWRSPLGIPAALR
jgi:hypothetical protein